MEAIGILPRIFPLGLKRSDRFLDLRPGRVTPGSESEPLAAKRNHFLIKRTCKFEDR